jgi:hypothetical protein
MSNDIKCFYTPELIKIIKLPITAENGYEVLRVLFHKYDDYLSVLKKLKNNKIISQGTIYKAERIIKKIKKSIDFYYKGNLIQSIDSIREVISDRKKLAGDLLIQKPKEALNGYTKLLYRARLGDYYGYDNKEMMHIPFNKRSIIQNQRYSVSGMPCLYLSTSPQTCWEELGRPNFNNVWISRFELVDTDLKIINLSYNYMDFISNKKQMDKDKFEKIILTWILQCACSVVVNSRTERVFKEEYIIPQVLMLALIEEGYDGIYYFSLRNVNIINTFNKKLYFHNTMNNLALPVTDYNIFKNNSNMDFNKTKYNKYLSSKKISKMFKVTSPLNMGLVSSLLENYSKGSSIIRRKEELGYISPQRILNENNTIIFSKDHHYDYRDTNYYKIEKMLQDSIPF